MFSTASRDAEALGVTDQRLQRGHGLIRQRRGAVRGHQRVHHDMGPAQQSRGLDGPAGHLRARGVLFGAGVVPVVIGA